MATQVKFYSVDALPQTPNAGGLYFVKEGDTNFGQLYRGSQLIGAARVTKEETNPTTAIRGDINISTARGAEIYDGTKWVALSDASLTKRVSDIELVVKAGDKAVDGKSVVQADTGIFTNLTVSDTATFNATTVSATTLKVDTEDGATFGGKTISAIADREADARIAAIAEASASASANGVEVKVVTQSGSVTGVEVAVDATSSTGDIVKDSTKLVRAGDVAGYIADVAKAMHFRGLATVTVGENDAVTVTPSDGVKTNVKGDVVITTTGKEYVWTGDAWQELGDETALGALSDYAGYSTVLTTTSKTLAGGINELDAAIKGMDSSFTIAADNGVAANLTQVDGKITAFGLTVDAVESAGGITTGEGKVVTAGAVADKIAGIVDGLDATVSASNKGVEVTVVETDGKLTSATVAVSAASSMALNDKGSADVLATTAAVANYFENNLVWLDANGAALA